jgi:hypothetical protein
LFPVLADALHGRNPNHKMDDHALWINEVLRSRWYTVTFGCIIVIDMLLAVLERPTSLRAIPAATWSFQYTGIIELLCLLVFSADVALRYQYLTREQFWRSRWTLAKMAFVSLAIVNTVLYLALGDSFPRIHRFVRPLMVAAHFRNVSKIFGNMIVSIPRVANVAVLLVFHVVFFGVLAHVMFGGIACTVDELDHWTCDCAVKSETGDFCSPFSKNCYDYFGNIGCAMDQLFILLTTANFPDVMLPAYHCFAWAPVFFVSYLVIGLFFMLNLVLAVSYSVFQGHTKDKVLGTVNHRVITLDRVYDGVRTSQHFATDEAVDASEAEGGLTAKQQRKRRKLAKLAKAQSGRPATASFDLHASGDGDSDADADVAARGAQVGGVVGAGGDAPQTSFGNGASGAASRTGRAGSQTAGAELAKLRRGASSDDQDAEATADTGDAKLTSWSGERGVGAGARARAGAGEEALGRKSEAPALNGLPGEMGWPMWRRLMRLLRPDLTEAQIAVLFRTVDSRGVGSIGKEDFREISNFIEVQFYAKLSGRRSEYFCYQCVPQWVTEWRQSVRIVVQHWIFRTFFDLLIYVNAFLIVIDFSLTPQSSADQLVNLLMLVLLAAFAVELAIKLFGLGARAFVQDWFNVLDAVIVPAAIIADIVLSATGTKNRIVEKIAFLRILRLLRALRALPNFGLLIRTFSSIVPMFARYMLVAVLVYYMFAILGMELFAGLIEPPGPGLRPPASLNDTAYLLNSYWDVTFNSLGRSYVTLFALMVVNNWAITMEGYAAVTNRWFMIYFYLWYFVIVILVLNIVTAFLLDDFTVMQAQIEDEENGLMPSWHKRLLQAARELRVRDRKNWTISRPKHPQQVYELMFADDIAEHLSSMDTIDSGLGQGSGEGTMYGSGGDGVRHRATAAAAAAALLEMDSRAGGAGAGDGDGRLPFDPSAVLTHAGDVASRTSIELPKTGAAVGRSASLQQVDSTAGAARNGQPMRALQLIAMDGAVEDWSQPSPLASADEEDQLLAPAASSGRHTTGNHVEALQRTKRASLHHTATDGKAVPATGFGDF